MNIGVNNQEVSSCDKLISAENLGRLPTVPLMQIDVIVVGALQVNCYLVADRETGSAVVIDPGDEPDRILDRIAQRRYRIGAILLTHAHFDHILGVQDVKETLGVPVMMSKADLFLYTRLPEIAQHYGFHAEEPPPIDCYLKAGDTLPVGSQTLTVLETPGHSPGGLSFLAAGEPDCLFGGDALFQGSIGRTDLPGASFDLLCTSIRNQLYTLNSRTVVYPGHGPVTTIADEREHNPFVRA